MKTAEDRLALWRTLEEAVDATSSVVEACAALGLCILKHTGATEALVIARGQGDRYLRSGDNSLRSGDEGQMVLSEEIRATARIISGAQDAWKETLWEETLARPIRSRDEVIGAILLRRAGSGPTPEDRAVLEEIEVRAARLLRAAVDRSLLEERNLELATIYEIDHIRDEHLEFEDMLQKIMGRVLELIPADGAVVALRSVHDDGERRLVNHLRGRAGADAAMRRLLEEHDTAIGEIVQHGFEARSYASHRLAGDAPRTIDCMPLILDDEILGGFLLISAPGQRFSARDERLFRAVCSQTDTAIFEDLARQRLKDVFKRYVSRDVFEQMLESGDDFLSGRRTEITCFFSDLRGFTTVAEQLPTSVVVEILNEHLDAMTNIVFDHGGTVDKFIGDCVMAFFGAPLPQEDHVERAVKCAIAMRAAHQKIALGWAARGLPDVRIGIGMHTGKVFVGPIGGDKLVSYTIIGDDVNLASRLEGKSGPDEIIVTQAIADKLIGDYDLEERGDVTVRGKTIPVTIYNLADSSPDSVARARATPAGTTTKADAKPKEPEG